MLDPGSRVPTCPGGRPRDSDPRQADAISKRVYWTFAQTGSPPPRKKRALISNYRHLLKAKRPLKGKETGGVA